MMIINGAEPLRLRVVARDRLREDFDILVDQLRAIDNLRLVDGPIASLTLDELDRLREYSLEVMGV